MVIWGGTWPIGRWLVSEEVGGETIPPLMIAIIRYFLAIPCFLFILRFKEKADRLYIADVLGDWREEIIVLNGKELHIYSNNEQNPYPKHPSLWTKNYYRRSKMTWNYYNP